MVAASNGHSSYSIARHVGVCQKTAYFMMCNIRLMLEQDFDLVLLGIVEGDEAFFGGLNKNRHVQKKFKGITGRAVVDKTAALCLTQRGGKKMVIVIPDTSAESIQAVIRKMVKPGTILMVDDWTGYDGLEPDYTVIKVKEKGKKGYYGDAYRNTNTAEGLWTFLKHMYRATYRKISRRKLQSYIDEGMFRVNTIKDNWVRLIEALKKAKVLKLLWKHHKRKDAKVPVPHLSW